MEPWSRRKFFLTSLAGSFVAGAGKVFGRSLPAGEAGLPSSTPTDTTEGAFTPRLEKYAFRSELW